MPNIRLTLAYDGTDFAGWQCQLNGLSVQEVLETALHKLVGHPVSCRAAGRTDAGVHALGQVVTFRLGDADPGAAPAADAPVSADATEATPAADAPVSADATGAAPAADARISADATRTAPSADARVSADATRTAPATDARVSADATGTSPQFAARSRPLSVRALVHGTNHHLPPTIRVLAAQIVADDFDARFSASGKLYRYQIWNADTESPLHSRTHWHVRAELDLTAMRRAAQLLCGHHDFRAFRASNCERRTTDRTVRRLEVLRQTECAAALHIEVEGTAFLRNMVRILAGTLVYVGRGKLRVEDVAALLVSGDRTQAGPTAPASGLILCRVDYGPRVGV